MIVRDPAEPSISDMVVNWSGESKFADINGETQTNKLKQLEAFRDAGLRTPLFIEGSHFQGWLPRSLNHRAGRDFTSNEPCDFQTQPIQSRREWRAHVVMDTPTSGRVVRLGRKVETEGGRLEINGIPIRSRSLGWKIKYYDSSKPWLHKIPGRTDVLDLYNHAIWALMVQGWDMGAVDVLEGVDGKAYVLEANSCPGLGDANTAKVYADHVEGRYAEHRTRCAA